MVQSLTSMHHPLLSATLRSTPTLRPKMSLNPSYATAALAGLITSVGMMTYELLAARLQIQDKSGVIWILATAIFLALPVYVLVLGRGSRPLGAQWLKDPAERERQWAIIRRLLVWLVTAGVVMGLWSLFGWSTVTQP